MTGLFIKELIARGDLKRCLIVTPGNLAEQWQDELFRKFHLRFEVLTNDRIESAVSGNIFTEMNFCIARLDKLSRSEALQEKLRITDWDLIVCDEAHKMSATVWGGEIKYTKRFNLGRLLSEITRNFLLLTATPHNGKNEDFQLFLLLVDPDRFEGAARSSNQSIDVSDVMRRLVKEELLKFDGTPLFPERRAYTVNYDLSPAEGQLYSEVTSYVQEEFNRADNLNNERKTTVGSREESSSHFRSTPLTRTSFAIFSRRFSVLISISSSAMVAAAEAWSTTFSSTASCSSGVRSSSSSMS